LVNNLLPDAGELLQDNFGCYVLQKIIETVHSSQLGELMNEHIIPRYFDLSVHQYSCRVMQDVFRYFDSANKIKITDSVLQSVLQLCQDGYGNYVVQKMIHYGDVELRGKVCDALLPYVVQLCCNKAGSNILEKCLSKASDLRKVELMKPIIENEEKSLAKIVGDKFGNYVIQRMLVSLPYEERKTLINSLKAYFDERDLSALNDNENYVHQQIMKK
jgi:pumilio RNA-binding family